MLPYVRFAAMTVVMYFIMYGFMYAMVDRWENVFNSINQAYMAGLMTAPMVLIELAIMRAMYPNRIANIGIVAASLAVLAISWFGIRQQWRVDDQQFLRSMIPHHAGAILMCEQASIERAEIKALCGEIVRGQNEEIARMKALLAQ